MKIPEDALIPDAKLTRYLLELYQEIALNRDFPEYNLQRGDIATLIDYVTDPTGGEEGAVLEVFNALGETVSVVTVPVSSMDTLRPNDILSVRRLAQAS